jgi:hypothetical protein
MARSSAIGASRVSRACATPILFTRNGTGSVSAAGVTWPARVVDASQPFAGRCGAA